MDDEGRECASGLSPQSAERVCRPYRQLPCRIPRNRWTFDIWHPVVEQPNSRARIVVFLFLIPSHLTPDATHLCSSMKPRSGGRRTMHVAVSTRSSIKRVQRLESGPGMHSAIAAGLLGGGHEVGEVGLAVWHSYLGLSFSRY
jgi:hypothetical protein